MPACFCRYTDSASADASGQLQPQYRQWFHCYDLGTQLGPVIKEHEAYLQSEAAKCSESSHSVDVRYVAFALTTARTDSD